MSRQEIHSAAMPIEQLAPIVDPKNYDGDLLLGERVMSNDYAEALKFNEDAVTIRLEPSSDQNASKAFPVWVNGQGAEVLLNGRWVSMTYLPVGEEVTVRRKVLENILRAKVNKVTNEVDGPESEQPYNRITRITTAVQTVSIIQDNNPRGSAWAREIVRRNM